MSPGLWSATRLTPGQLSLAVGGVLPERALVDQYCVGCHGGKVKAAGLALDASRAESVSQHPEAWEKVVQKLRARYMPPAGLPRPDERGYDAAVLDWRREGDTYLNEPETDRTWPGYRSPVPESA